MKTMERTPQRREPPELWWGQEESGLLWELEKMVWGKLEPHCGRPSVIEHLRGGQPSHAHSNDVIRAAVLW